MYTAPPQVKFVVVTTAAVINTDTVRTVIAAVAGQAYRIAGIVCWLNQNATGVVRFHFSSVSLNIFYGVSIGGNGASSVAYNFPAPGIQLAANEALTETDAASVVSQATRLSVYYYVDSVS